MLPEALVVVVVFTEVEVVALLVVLLDVAPLVVVVVFVVPEPELPPCEWKRSELL